MNGYLSHEAEQIEFEDITLVEAAETFVYRCVVEEQVLFFETVAYPTGRELLDAALGAYRGRE